MEEKGPGTEEGRRCVNLLVTFGSQAVILVNIKYPVEQAALEEDPDYL